MERVTLADVNAFGWHSIDPDATVVLTASTLAAQLTLIGRLLLEIRDALERRPRITEDASTRVQAPRGATIAGDPIPTPPPRRCAACQVTLDAPSEYKDDRGLDLCPSCFWRSVSA